jgi:sugar lactone lactonase YvrE
VPVRLRPRWLLVGATSVAAAVAAWWLQPAPEETRLPAAMVVGVLAGDGQVGWLDGPALEARFSEPFGVAVAADGAAFVTDAGDSHRLRRIGVDGHVSTLAGGGRGLVDGRGPQARFATPSALAIDASGVLYVADTGNHAIRRVTPDGQVTTLAGDGIAGDLDGPAGSARFNAPVGVAVDTRGRVIVADTYNDRIRAISPDGQVTTLAGGTEPGYVDGGPLAARFDTPCGVAVAPDGRVLVADTGNGIVRVIAPDGQVTSLSSPMLELQRPMAVAANATGDVLVADESGAVVAFPAAGDAVQLAGGDVGFENGLGVEARFRRPSGLAVRPAAAAAAADVLVADAGNALVRRLAPEPRARRAPVMDILQGLAAAPALAPPSRPRTPPAFDAATFGRSPLLWPVAPVEGPHEVAGTFGEARGGAGQERFHAGLDVREPQGTLVRAVRDGIVASPISTGAFDTINEFLRIGPLTYVHIRAGRTQDVARRRAPPRIEVLDLQRFAPVFDAEGGLLRMRVKRGAAFAAGEPIATVNTFNHVHLNVGWAGEEHNPLRFRLVQFVDDIPPSIAAHGIRLFDEAWQPLNPDRIGAPRRGRRARPRRLPPVSPVVVRGRVRIVVDAWDQANGNQPYRRLGLYSAGYELVDRNGVVVAGLPDTRETLRFDRMRRQPEAARQVFASGSGIPVYGARQTQFLYVVTTRYRDGVAAEDFWDTSRVAPGEYVLRVFARDFDGNVAGANRELRVIVTP